MTTTKVVFKGPSKAAKPLPNDVMKIINRLKNIKVKRVWKGAIKYIKLIKLFLTKIQPI